LLIGRPGAESERGVNMARLQGVLDGFAFDEAGNMTPRQALGLPLRRKKRISLPGVDPV
jgi:hypothetical protein